MGIAMIKLIAQSGKRNEEIVRFVHPEWQTWMDASAYTHAEAKRELDLANGTFYRRIAKEPTNTDRLAMSALYEGLEPFGSKIKAA
jgi:hypothetical protein